MEACFVNLVEPGDTVIVGVNGVFGERMCEVARRSGAEVVRVDAEWGSPLDPAGACSTRSAAHPEARVLAVVHAETSTGVENDVAPLRAVADTDTLLLVDTVTSLGGIPLHVDDWGIDACYSGTQKCLGVPPGLSPVTFSPRAVERIGVRTDPVQSWYLDLGLIGDYVGTARKYHHTAPTGMIVALHAGLGVVLDEGLDAVWARHQDVGRSAPGRARRTLGFSLIAARGLAAAAAHLGPAARRRGRGRAAPTAARRVRHRGRRRARRVRRRGVADRADGPHRARAARWPRSSVRSGPALTRSGARRTRPRSSSAASVCSMLRAVVVVALGDAAREPCRRTSRTRRGRRSTSR